MNYQDIIAQALRAGFKPYAGNPAQMQAMVNGLEVNPYLETVGQTEQDPGTAQQMGYTVSTPLGGTRYRTDVVDMNGNLLRSNVHDAGADKYGLGDMAKLAAVALGANALGSALGQPSMFSPGGLLGSSGAPALTGYDAAMADLAASGGLTGASMAGAAGAAGSTLGTAAGAGAAGGLLKAALPIAGAVLGGTSGGKTTTSNTTKEMDPRLANYVYGADGTGGLLGSATKLFNDQMATGGLNELQRQGIDLQKSWLMNPAYAQGYTNMMNVGQGLLGGGVAGNPFRRP